MDMKNSIRLHLGCGKDYREGWTNVDFNKEVKADMYLDLNKPLPFKDNSVSEIFTEGAVEHIKRDDVFRFYDELWRICHNGAKIRILTNHFSSVWASQHLGHNCFYGTSTFGIMSPEDCFNGERYNKARFKVNKMKLLFFYPKMVNHNFLAKIPINWIFNFSLGWQRIMERFQFLGFDGIYYELEVVK